MQILFSQTEIRDALIEALDKQIIIQPGQRVEIEFDLTDPMDVVAYVDILRDGQTAAGISSSKIDPPKEQLKEPVIEPTADAPAPRRTRGPNKPKPAVTNEAPAPEPTEEVTEDPEPADEGTGEASKDVVMAVLDEGKDGGEAKVEAQEKPANNVVGSIFPNAATSAPPKEAAAPAPKSLFANLTKPNNAATTH